MTMLGSPCSPCCTSCVSVCPYRFMLDDLDSGVGQCDLRDFVFANRARTFASSRKGLRCGEVAVGHAPGKVKSVSVPDVGYNGIVEVLSQLEALDVYEVGETYGAVANAIFARNPNGAALQKGRVGYIEPPVLAFNTALNRTDTKSFRLWSDALNVNIRFRCDNSRLSIQASWEYIFTDTRNIDFVRSAWSLRNTCKTEITNATILDQVVEGGDPVEIRISESDFVFGGSSIGWDLRQTRNNSTALNSSLLFPQPEPGPLFGEEMIIQIYRPVQGCCDGNSCNESNPLP